jgi:prophage regulatory protein
VRETIPITEQFLTVTEVARRYAVGRATVWRWSSDRPGFPRPVKLGPGTTRWRRSALEYFESRIEQSWGILPKTVSKAHQNTDFSAGWVSENSEQRSHAATVAARSRPNLDDE